MSQASLFGGASLGRTLGIILAGMAVCVLVGAVVRRWVVKRREAAITGFAAASPEAGVAVGDTAELSLLSPRGQATLDGTTLFGVRALEHGVTGGIPQVQSLLLTPSTNSEPPIMSGLNDGAEDIPNRPDDHPMLSTRRFMGPAIKDEPRSVLGRGTPAQTEEARRG